VLQNVGLLALGILTGMHATLLMPWLARKCPGGSFGALRERDRHFLLAWAVVPLLFFVLVHTGQPGYALLIVPIGYLWVASAVAQVVERSKTMLAADGKSPYHRAPRLPFILGALSVSGLVAFVAVPSLTYRAAASELMAQEVGVPEDAHDLLVPGHGQVVHPKLEHPPQGLEHRHALWKRLQGTAHDIPHRSFGAQSRGHTAR
jgi:hypothetical protein